MKIKWATRNHTKSHVLNNSCFRTFLVAFKSTSALLRPKTTVAKLSLKVHFPNDLADALASGGHGYRSHWSPNFVKDQLARWIPGLGRLQGSKKAPPRLTHVLVFETQGLLQFIAAGPRPRLTRAHPREGSPLNPPHSSQGITSPSPFNSCNRPFSPSPTPQLFDRIVIV